MNTTQPNNSENVPKDYEPIIPKKYSKSARIAASAFLVVIFITILASLVAIPSINPQSVEASLEALAEEQVQLQLDLSDGKALEEDLNTQIDDLQETLSDQVDVNNITREKLETNKNLQIEAINSPLEEDVF